MKSTITLFIVLFTLSLSAQYQKGNWYLDGATNAGYQRSVGKNTPDGSSFFANAFRAGYFFTDRLLVGSRVSFLSYSDQVFIEGNTILQLRPFARYYFPGGDQRKVRFFGDVGFGTFDLFSKYILETDFHFGGGAEISLKPGIQGTANLRYDANADGLNFTNLTFGLNVLMGQLENAGAAVSLTAGTFMAQTRLGSVRHGRMSANGNLDQSTSFNLTPWVGYFITSRLMLEGGLGLFYGSSSNQISDTNLGMLSFSSVSVGANLNARYYLKQDGKLFPYLVAGGGFSLNTTKFNNSFGASTNTTKSIPLRGGVGANYFLSPNLALDAAIMYDQRNQIDQFQNADSATRKYLSLDVGFRFFLPKG
ncbi:MAG: outer membrane protein W [Neolewinella sp.]|jgi:outer membrane protein W